MIKKKRRRVTARDVQKRAKQGPGGGGGNQWLKLPDGVEMWVPPKEGTYDLNIWPYVTSDQNHPDGVDPDTIWYQRSFRAHRDGNGNSFVCPRSADRTAKQDDWCRQFFRLRKEGASKEEQRPFTGQLIVAYNIEHPEEEGKCAVMALSYGKFAKTLEKELKKGSRKNALFFETRPGKGRTLRVRFDEEQMPGGNKFLQANKIDFIPRKGMDEDEVLAKTVDLDKAIKVLDPATLHKMFLQVDEEDEQEGKGKKEKKSGELTEGRKKRIARLKAEAAEKTAGDVKKLKKKRLKEKKAKHEDPEDE